MRKDQKPGYFKYFEKFAWKCATSPDENFRDLLFLLFVSSAVSQKRKFYMILFELNLYIERFYTRKKIIKNRF